MNNAKQVNAFSYGNFQWWMGVVEDRNDPMKLGRLRVRIFGYHTSDKGKMPTETLQWAMVMQPITSAAISGIGTSPTGIVEGSHVIGFFVDGSDCQVPLIMGTYGAIPEKQNSEDNAFGDPNGKYPKYTSEADTNRLARNEKITETIVQKKKDSRIKSIPKAFDGQWDEKETTYQAKYPYNHVRETESGHIEEFDDTNGKERIHVYHKSGTFKEIHNDGTQVEKIVKDNYELIMGNDFVYIKGNTSVTIDGTSKILVKGNAEIEVNGNCKEHIKGNYELKVNGSFDLTVGGHQYSTTGGLEKRNAAMIHLNS